MENKSSNEYVAELLKQLDELKRKKALKERKLQKLKTNAVTDHPKEQAQRITCTLFHKPTDPLLHENSSKLVSGDDDCGKTKKYKENCNNSNSLSDKDQHKFERNSIENVEFEAPISKNDVHNTKYVTKTFDSNCLSFEKNDYKRLKRTLTSYDNLAAEKSSLIDENGGKKVSLSGPISLGEDCQIKEKCGVEVSREKCDVSEVNVDTKILFSERNNTERHSFCDASKENSLNKSVSGKDKISDILNDSLNSNMSCFLSAEFFPADDHTQELVFKNNSSTTSMQEITKHVNTSEQVAATSRSPLSVVPYTIYNQNQQNNLENFNFPKFSTPTDRVNFLSSSDENIKSQNKVVSVSSAEYISSVNKTCKDYSETKNTFDSAQVSLIIGKGLCSVLDAHYTSPNKSTEPKNVLLDIHHKDIQAQSKAVFKEKFPENQNSVRSSEYNKDMDDENFVSTDEFNNHSDSLMESVNSVDNSFIDVQSQVTKTVCGLVNRVCEDSKNVTNLKIDTCVDLKADSEILVIPETENLGLYFSKNVDDFLETSTLSESLNEFHTKDNFLNVSSQSKLESPVVNRIVAAVRDSITFNKIYQESGLTDEKISDSDMANFSAMETSLLEDDTQELGNCKQVPYMNKDGGESACKFDTKMESNLNFVSSLQGSPDEAVVDVELILFGDVQYAFIQHRTEIHVWRQEKKKKWIKTFSHPIENMLSLVKICTTQDENNLAVILLLNNGVRYCLQFLLFERDVQLIKVMENTHWLDKRHSCEPVLLCGLEGLMFASAHSSKEVSLHAFIGLKDSPRLMTACLDPADRPLHSLCKINNLPNALLGIGDSMLYVWHILEARLVTSVNLYPPDYYPIRSCFWATVENGLIYLLTTCEGPEKHVLCELLAANLATGFCQTAMKFSSRPSRHESFELTKAAYVEPFLLASGPMGVLMWSVDEEQCCAALHCPGTTSVAVSGDCHNWALVAVGSGHGRVQCYALN